MQQSPHHQAGFTILEVVIIIVAIAILLAIAYLS
ncbi:MAG TPA: prepilin-type N-terminal cleavage/methylation domain-containing protein [Candidatus Saccharimonadales bacterium]|jgi:prepilin-type N-terminal cleavage/methylation domain-containing protein|nr:prepilin-type N-terminal cleavage/methylation domain-containing protein [Candidatus Saccharimonadales bacterium]